MTGSLLLTSFTTWKPEQVSNSSDDLLGIVAADRLQHDAHKTTPREYLRKIPVDFDLAPQRVIHHIQRHQPRAVICCGMGESRSTLDIESTAVHDQAHLHPPVDLGWLSKGLSFTQISDDAGRFVCNRLYYRVLNYLYQNDPELPCIFVHVPLLTVQNHAAIVQDFRTILDRMDRLASWAERPLASV